MFGGGGGGLDPRKMKQMMEQMGIDMEDIDAEEVIIRTPDEDLVFDDADVQLMAAQGQKTYQVVGDPESRARGAADAGGGEGDAGGGEGDVGGGEAAAGGDEASDAATDEPEIPDDDVEIVAMRADVGEDEAREALEATDGDLAAAVDRLE